MKMITCKTPKWLCFSRLVFPFIALSFFNSCEESDSVTGPPPGESLDKGPVSVEKAIHTIKTSEIDNVETDELSRDMLGTHYDTVFGQSQAMIYTNFKLPDEGFSPTFIENPGNLDSVVLILPYGGENAFFGNKATEQTIAFYELQERLYRENNYQSDETFDHGENRFGQWTGALDPSNNALRVRLNQEMEDKFRNASENNLNNGESFEGFFNGLFIKPEDDFMSQNEGAITYFELQEGARLKFYHNDTMQDSAVVNGEAARVNTYSETDFTGVKADTGSGQPYAYIKPLAGLKATLRFPELEKWVEDGLVAVHKAEVVVPATSFYHETFDPPGVLRMEATNRAGEVLSATRTEYDEDNQQYVFNIPLYFQDVFKAYAEGRQPDVGGLDITIPEDEPALANPLLVPLGKNNSGADSVKVELTYSKVDEQ